MKDKQILILKYLQDDIPYGLNPYKEIAENIGCSETQLLDFIREFQKSGHIRRFCAILRHQEIGYTSNAMCVWQLPEDVVDSVAKLLVERQEISHCYKRQTNVKWDYNLFCMVHGHSKADCENIIKNIADITNEYKYRLIFSTREFKKTSLVLF